MKLRGEAGVNQFLRGEMEVVDPRAYPLPCLRSHMAYAGEIR